MTTILFPDEYVEKWMELDPTSDELERFLMEVQAARESGEKANYRQPGFVSAATVKLLRQYHIKDDTLRDIILRSQTGKPPDDWPEGLKRTTPGYLLRLMDEDSVRRNKAANRYGHPRFYELLEQMAATHDRKGRDYTSHRNGSDPLANYRELEECGVPAYVALVSRLGDKWNRIKSLLPHRGRNRSVADETLIDTHIDSAVQHLFCVIFLEEEARVYAAANPTTMAEECSDTGVPASPSGGVGSGSL